MSTAGDRIAAFVALRKGMPGLDPQVVISVGSHDGPVDLTLADLEAVLLHAPRTAYCPKCKTEVGHTSEHLRGGLKPGWYCPDREPVSL